MKKIKFQKKLSLNKETIAKLNENQMDQIQGGYSHTCACYNYTGGMWRARPRPTMTVPTGNYCTGLCSARCNR